MMKLRVPHCWMALLTLASLNMAAQARLAFKHPRLELKAQPGATHVDYVFSFQNTGKDIVVVNKVSSSCGCTTAKLKKNTFQPDEFGELKGRFTFEGRTGYQHKSIRLETDDFQQPNIELSFSLDIPKVVEVSPVFIYWDLNGDRKRQPVTIKLAEGIRSEVPQIQTKLSRWDAEMKIIKKGEEFRLILSPRDLESKRLDGIKLSLELSTGATKEIMVYAAVK